MTFKRTVTPEACDVSEWLFVNWKSLPYIKFKCLRMHNCPSQSTHQNRIVCFMILNIPNTSTYSDSIQIRRKR